MARKLAVEIVGDSRSLERAFARSSRSAKTFQASITGVSRGISSTFGALGVGLGAAGVAAAIKSSIDAASNLNEEVTKSQQIFGQSADDVEAWSKTTTKAFKLSQRESLEAAGNFGAMFRTIGLGTQQTAQMARRLTELGADMASFNNQDPSEMLDRLRSGLAGEAEPLRRFGVLLSEARVKQEAYRSGIAKSGATLTEAQKVLARYQLILKDTALQQGDAARTGGNWAGVQRELAANLENLSAKLGSVLLPKITDVVKEWNRWLEDPENQIMLVQGLTGAVEDLASAMAEVADDAQKVIHAVEELHGRYRDTSNFFDRHHLSFLNRPGLDLFDSLTNQIARLPYAAKQATKEIRLLGGVSREALHPESILGIHTPGPLGAGRPRRTPPPPGGSGMTAQQRATIRNRIFDARIARQLDRLQDLGLRKQLARLRAIAQEVRGQRATVSDAERRASLEDQLLDIYRQQRSVQEQITDQIKEANQALKARAEAIKSALIDRLQRRQADRANRRALADAQARLREAIAIGGPRGAALARENLANVRDDILIGQIQASRASLTKGGKFTLGNVVTINVHGVTDPDAVARKVAEVLQRRRRHTTTSPRGPGAGTPAGAH